MLQGIKKKKGCKFMVSGIQGFENLKMPMDDRFINIYKAIKKFNNTKNIYKYLSTYNIQPYPQASYNLAASQKSPIKVKKRK